MYARIVVYILTTESDVICSGLSVIMEHVCWSWFTAEMVTAVMLDIVSNMAAFAYNNVNRFRLKIVAKHNTI